MKREEEDDNNMHGQSSVDDHHSNEAAVVEEPPSKKPKTDTSVSVGEVEATNVVALKPSKASSKGNSTKGSPKRDSSQSGGGRIRLPDKLLKFLNDEPMPEVIWWMPDGNGFAYNAQTVQTKFLDKCFKGTKLSSFVRSLNRW